ncbi:MAG: amidohydrolase family protein [Deltaproteobacteria bacterium]|nr:amidohydrolase family protein [Deltaproteobacteria bacterium]
MRTTGLALLSPSLSLGLVLLAGNACSEASVAPSEIDGILLTEVTVISPERSEPLTDAWVEVRNGLIEAIGQGEPPRSTADLPRKEGGDRYLLPGLIDSHVHLESIPGMAFPQQQANPKLVKAYRRQLPRSYLFHGFTSLIDLAPGNPEVLETIRRSPVAPDIFSCSNPLVLANGYPMAFLPPRLRFRLYPNFLYDPRQADAIPEKFRPEDHSPAAGVKRVADAGGICVKTFVEDGFGVQKTWPVPTVEMLSAIKTAARQHQIPMTVHANSFDAYALALDGGADVLVHGLWTWDRHQEADRAPGSDLPEPLQDLAQRVITSGTAVMPTLQVLAGDRALFDSTFLADPRLLQVLPTELVSWYSSEEGGWFAQNLLEGLPPDQQTPQAAYDGHTEALSRGERVATYLAHHGGRILFGSDTPSGPSYGNPPGYNGFLEMRRLAATGLPLDRLLAAATLENARAFGLEDRFGSIAKGKVANLLLLEKNPLETVEAYDTIAGVILHGQWLDRESLTANRLEEP